MNAQRGGLSPVSGTKTAAKAETEAAEAVTTSAAIELVDVGRWGASSGASTRREGSGGGRP